jgi:hypothetical protein
MGGGQMGTSHQRRLARWARRHPFSGLKRCKRYAEPPTRAWKHTSNMRANTPVTCVQTHQKHACSVHTAVVGSQVQWCGVGKDGIVGSRAPLQVRPKLVQHRHALSIALDLQTSKQAKSHTAAATHNSHKCREGSREDVHKQQANEHMGGACYPGSSTWMEQRKPGRESAHTCSTADRMGLNPSMAATNSNSAWRREVGRPTAPAPAPVPAASPAPVVVAAMMRCKRA